MEEQLLHFTKQFAWEPEILDSERLPVYFSHTIVCGMGGSHLGARALLRVDPTLPLSIHSDYGLPRESADRLGQALIVASSYSGETEEVLDVARTAVEAGLAVAVITTGGALKSFAEQHALPRIIIPKEGVEPRMAVGAEMLALARLMRREDIEEEVRSVGSKLNVKKGRLAGEALAKSLSGKIPVLYSSTLSAPVVYFWKIAFNETGKIPAFYNVFPELCHNELSGFDTTESAQALSAPLHMLMLRDSDDHPRITKRMQIMQQLLEAHGDAVTTVDLPGDTPIEKALYGILMGVWTALALAKHYDAPDAATPLIAEFKKKMLDV